MTSATTMPDLTVVPRKSRVARPARLAIATINRSDGDTGVHAHTRILAAGMRDASVECDVISPFTGTRLWVPVFAIRPLLLHRFNRTWSTLWHRRWHMAALRRNLLRHLSKARPDVVLAQCPVSARAALDVRDALNASFRVAMVCHFNHSEAAEYRDKGELSDSAHYQAMLAFEAHVLEEVDRVIYVSQWARQNVEGVRGLHTKSSAVVLNGIPQLASSRSSRSDIGLTDNDLVLMNVGSLEPRKNQLALLDLFAMIRDHFNRAKLVLIGDGPARDEIRQRIAEKKLADSVRLLGHRRDAAALLPLADMYVHYATLENCPLVLLEAARAGTPIAAVPTGGVPELQAALDCKIELHPDDLRGTLARLTPLLQDADLRKKCGERARSAFARSFTGDSMTQNYLEALSFD